MRNAWLALLLVLVTALPAGVAVGQRAPASPARPASPAAAVVEAPTSQPIDNPLGVPDLTRFAPPAS